MAWNDWNITVGESRQEGGSVTVPVKLALKSGGPEHQEHFTYDGTPAGLKRAVKNWIDRRDATTNALKCVPPGPLDITPDAPAQPTAEQIARDAFATAWKLFCTLDNAVSAGLIPTNDTEYLAAKADMATKYGSVRSRLDLCESI